jgi:hypothetical protein
MWNIKIEGIVSWSVGHLYITGVKKMRNLPSSDREYWSGGIQRKNARKRREDVIHIAGYGCNCELLAGAAYPVSMG